MPSRPLSQHPSTVDPISVFSLRTLTGGIFPWILLRNRWLLYIQKRTRPFSSSSSESDREHVYPSFNLIYEIKSNKINVLLWFTATQPTAIIQPYNAHVRNEFLQGCHFCLLGKSFLPPSSLSLPFSSFPSYLPILYLHENKLITLISKSDSVLESVIKLKVFMLINRPFVILLSLCVCTESAHTRFNSDSLLSSPFSCRAHPDLQLPLCACRLPASPTGLQMPWRKD